MSHTAPVEGKGVTLSVTVDDRQLHDLAARWQDCSLTASESRMIGY